MHRAFVDSISPDFSLDTKTAHRFSRVLRIKPGEQVELFDGQGNVVRGHFQPEPSPCLSEAQLEKIAPDNPPITLFQALLPMEKLESIVQHATELGVSEIVIFRAERSQIDFGAKTPAKLERLIRIAQDACRQCGRAWVPVIKIVTQPDFKGQLYIGLPTAQGGFPDSISADLGMIIGPEGGFSPNEIDTFKKLGAKSVRLAKHVLRAETASLAALAQIQGAL